MCGIATIYAYHYAAPEVDRDELRRIRDHMAARGPDGKGEWFSKDGRIAIGHRRLSIIDLSEKGAQPMGNPNGNLVISFNGEIYNYKELRRQLENNGYVFRSHSDTEVLLHLYAEKGAEMVHDLRGMFAFSLWDGNKRKLLLARDPYGIKPLYYADDGWTVRIASQVKALLASEKVSRQQEPAGIVGFYLFGSVPEPYTTFQEIRAVPAGNLIWIDDLGPSAPKPYFSIARVFSEATENPRPLSKSELQETVRTALLDSMRHHMVADVPVGAFLSAGVDSGSLVGLMRDVDHDSQKHIQTVTLAFEEFRGRHDDESPLAEHVARQYGTQHRTRVVTEKEFREDLPKILEAMDQPSIDGINIWFVSKAAKESGLKVAISGLGGDELFGGYPSFTDIPKWVRMMAIPSRIPFLGDLFRMVYQSLITSHQSPKAAGLVKYAGTYPGAYFLRRGLFMPWELKGLLDKDVIREGMRRLMPLAHIRRALQPDPGTTYGRVATLEASLYMRNQLLRDTDWASMAHSLEVRTPLVDAELIRQLAPMLVAQPGVQGKRLMARSPRQPLDVGISERPKSGFGVPIDHWVQKDQKLNAWQGIPTLRRNGCHWSRRWAYTVSTALTA